MDRIAIVSLSLHQVDVGGLERARRALGSDCMPMARELADRLAASELVLLSTCNRLELAYAREEGHWPCAEDQDLVAAALGLDAPTRERLRHMTGRDAARHLFRVACSLDSLVVGEGQILAQVREAFARAEQGGLTGTLLGPLYAHAFQVGKQVRTQTELSHHPVSVVSIAAARLSRSFVGLRPRIAVLGAGVMGRMVARSLRDLGLEVALFVNRTPERAAELAQLHGGRALALADFVRGSEPVDALVAATAAPEVVLDRAALARLAARAPMGRPLLAVDVGLPRNVEPWGEDPRVQVVDLDALRSLAEENRALRCSAAADAERMVEEKLEIWARRFAERALSTALLELRSESERLVERELAQLFCGRLATLDPLQRQALERWARTAFGRLAHAPVAALKRFAADSERNGHAAPGERA